MGKSKYSNDYKVMVLEGGTIEFVKATLREIYKEQDGEAMIHFLEHSKRDSLIDCSLRVIESQYRKYVRAREHINDLVLKGQAVFITLTFTDDVLSKTSPTTRRRYVSRYLKQQSSFYVANVDFSPKKHREHYHAVVSNRCDLSQWQYGFVFVEKVRCHDYDAKRVARYVAKLTAHALKVQDLSTRLLYSRNVL